MVLIPVAVAIAKGVGGAIGANQRKQQARGDLSEAYRQGVARQSVLHADERQSGAERLVARGLSQGGGVDASGRELQRKGVARPVTVAGGSTATASPTGGYSAPVTNPLTRAYRAPGGPTNLGAQDVATRASEQRLENTELGTQYWNAMKDASNTATQETISGIASGIAQGFGVQNAYSGYQAAKDPRDAAAALSGPQPSSTTNGGSSLTANAFGGVNPVNPLKGGAWGTTVDEFNVVGGRRRA